MKQVICPACKTNQKPLKVKWKDAISPALSKYIVNPLKIATDIYEYAYFYKGGGENVSIILKCSNCKSFFSVCSYCNFIQHQPDYQKDLKITLNCASCQKKIIISDSADIPDFLKQ